mgnify:CR=1 FL=1
MNINRSILLLFVILSSSLHNKLAMAMEPGKAEVSIYQVQPQNVPVSFEYIGEIAASKEVEVRARITGIIEKRTLQETMWCWQFLPKGFTRRRHCPMR